MSNYYQREIDKVLGEQPEDIPIRVKFIGENGNSHWLSLPVDIVQKMRALVGTIDEDCVGDFLTEIAKNGLPKESSF